MAKKSSVTIGHVFRTIIWPRRNLIFIGLILIIISRLASLVLPGASKYLMDDVIVNGDMEMLKMLVSIVGGAIVVQSITSFLLTRILSVEAQHLIAKLRVKVQQKVIYLPIRFFDNTKSGELVSRIMSDVEGCSKSRRHRIGATRRGIDDCCNFIISTYQYKPDDDYICSCSCSYFRFYLS